MSLAAVATTYGPPDVLSLVDIDPGDPGAGEVLLDVRAAGVNPYDVKSYSGAYGTDPARLPIRPGSEVAGVVRAVGEAAEGAAGPVSVGDEVIAYPVRGGYAEQLVVAADRIVPKPDELTWEQAAGLMLTGTTAVHAVKATGVAKGETVLVHGAAGGVGLIAVQLARGLGARVIGTASPRRHDALRALGAEPVAYGPGLLQRLRELAPDGAAAAIDVAGTDEAIDASLAMVTDRRRIATLTNFRRAAQDGLLALGMGPGADPGTSIRDAARLELVRQVRAGRLKVAVAQVFSLEDVAAAHALVAGGHTPGKVVLVP